MKSKFLILFALSLLACATGTSFARGGGGGGGHGGGHSGHTTTYFYFTQSAQPAPVGHCVRNGLAIGDTVRLKDGTMASITVLSGPSSYCKNPEFPIGASVGPLSAQSCEFATPFNPDAGIYLPEGWRKQKLSCATMSKKKDIFFHAVNETIGAHFFMDDIARSRITSMADFAKTLRDRQSTNLGNPQPSEIEALEINGMPAWRFHVQGELKATQKEMVYTITIIDRGNDIVLLNAYLPAGLYADHVDELDDLAFDVKGLDNQPVVLDDKVSANP